MFFKELHYWNIDAEHRAWQEQYLAALDASNAANYRAPMFNSTKFANNSTIPTITKPYPEQKYFNPRLYATGKQSLAREDDFNGPHTPISRIASAGRMTSTSE